MKLFKLIEDFYVKHHKCENNMKLYSETFENDYLTSIEYECSVCSHRAVVNYPLELISKGHYLLTKAHSTLESYYNNKYVF